MRMARVNITVPDELIDQARTQGLNVSRITAQALREELDRLRKIAELDAYLADLDAALGPIPDDERITATSWADTILTTPPANTASVPKKQRSA
jgi:post-segregation antitoxin (ccd killing protein)